MPIGMNSPGAWEPVLSLDEIIGYVADEFARQQAIADSIAQQSESAFAGESCLLRDLVGHGVIEHRLRRHCGGYGQDCGLTFVSSFGHEVCGKSSDIWRRSARMRRQPRMCLAMSGHGGKVVCGRCSGARVDGFGVLVLGRVGLPSPQVAVAAAGALDSVCDAETAGVALACWWRPMVEVKPCV